MRIITEANKPESVVHTAGDVKGAIERTQAAAAYQQEALVRKFCGDKLAAEEYAKARQRGRRV